MCWRRDNSKRNPQPKRLTFTAQAADSSAGAITLLKYTPQAATITCNRCTFDVRRHIDRNRGCGCVCVWGGGASRRPQRAGRGPALRHARVPNLPPNGGTARELLACEHTHDTHARRLTAQGNTAASACSALLSDRGDIYGIGNKALTVKFIATSFLSEATAQGSARPIGFDTGFRACVGEGLRVRARVVRGCDQPRHTSAPTFTQSSVIQHRSPSHPYSPSTTPCSTQPPRPLLCQTTPRMVRWCADASLVV